MMRQMMGSIPGMGALRRGQKARGKAKKKGKGGGRPAGAGRGAVQGARPALDQRASQDGLAQGGTASPAALPSGFSALPGLGGDNGAFKLPPIRPGSGAQQPNLPPGLRGRPGKKGR